MEVTSFSLSPMNFAPQAKPANAVNLAPTESAKEPTDGFELTAKQAPSSKSKTSSKTSKSSGTHKPKSKTTHKSSHSKATVTAKFSYNPQDKLVMEPETYTIGSLDNSGGTVQTAKVKLNAPLAPAADGSYVFDQSSPSYHAANAFAAVNRTYNIFSEAYGEPIKWHFPAAQLKVNPDKGDNLNAYYQRQDGSLNFFHATDPKTNAVVFSGDSGEVVGHETGHALLDSIRPNYLGAWSPDPAGFHESFGDVIAMLTTLKDDATLDKVTAQTGGDLSKPNIAAALGEELGVAINDTAGKNRTGGDYTRDAINQLTWSDPSELQPSPSDVKQLGSEAHNYSRLWTGAFYDVLKGVVDGNLAAGQSPRDAIANGATEGLKMYARLLKDAPQGDFTYKDMANAFIKSDQDFNGGKHAELIRSVFTARKILPANAGLVAEAPLPQGSRTLAVQLDGERFDKFAGATVKHELSGEHASAVGDVVAGAKLEDRMQQLIANNDVLYTTPGQVLTDKDMVKPNGLPYAGIVQYDDNGKMTIERNTIVD